MDTKLISFQDHSDARGALVALEEKKEIPFSVKRIYYIFGVEQGVRRGYHAHRELHQLAVVMSGKCTILLDDGCSKEEVVLDNALSGLLIDPLIWHEMYDFSSDCVLMLLASDTYDEGDYIREYQGFLDEVESDS